MPKVAPRLAIRRNSTPSRLGSDASFTRAINFVCGRRAACGYGRDRDFGGNEVDHIVGFARLLRLLGTTGNPVLVGYLAYVVGLLIAIAVVMTTETGEPVQAAKIHRKRGLAINGSAQSR